MSLVSRLQKLESQILNNEGLPTLSQILATIPQDQKELRRVLIENLPHVGGIPFNDLWNLFPNEEFRAKVIQELKKMVIADHN